jgi:hypothetical protein
MYQNHARQLEPEKAASLYSTQYISAVIFQLPVVIIIAHWLNELWVLAFMMHMV